MRNYTFILAFFCAFFIGSFAAMAQNGRPQDRRENVEAAKVAFLTDKMGLTAEQSQKFWPLYNEYEAKRRDLVRSYRSEYREDVDQLSEQEAKARLDGMFSTREKELELEKEYVARYQRVISPNQIIKLYRSEREFTKLLLKKLEASNKAQ
jgi:Spy/CpxP family protein refolding chaperone